MAKVPVQKTVLRDGKTHTQTYWEETSAHKKGAAALGRLKAPAIQKVTSYPPSKSVVEAWNSSPLFNGDPFQEACVAAGYKPKAALYVSSALLKDNESLNDYIYDNGLDQMPRPKDGWDYKRLQGVDQRTGWSTAVESHGLTMEQAIEWCDAGFDFPWFGIPELMASGVSSSRAAEWNEHIKGQTSTGALLHLYRDELLSGMDIQEALQWRKDLSPHNPTPLDQRGVEYWRAGFKSKEAGRWDKLMYSSVKVDTVTRLRQLGWTPSSLKDILKDLNSRHIDDEYAQTIIRSTEALGDYKVVREWSSVTHAAWVDGYDDPQSLIAVKTAEEWRKDAETKTGVAISKSAYMTLARLTPSQRDLYLDLASERSGTHERSDRFVSRKMSLAKLIQSVDNASLLREKGFPLERMSEDRTVDVRHAYSPQNSPKSDSNKWLREMAVSLYWVNTQDNGVTKEQLASIVNNDSIDPVKLKDVLVQHGHAINGRVLEGMVSQGIKAPVSEGWL